MLIQIPAYRSGPTKPGQPYSFSEDDFRGKQADLGPRIYSPLYMEFLLMALTRCSHRIVGSLSSGSAWMTTA
jgi:hypothetical protein